MYLPVEEEVVIRFQTVIKMYLQLHQERIALLQMLGEEINAELLVVLADVL